LRQGPRDKLNTIGVFCFKEEIKWKAKNYAIWVPLFDDGFFWRATWEIMVDRNDSVFTARDQTDQWLIRERSVHLVALHIDYRHHTDMGNGEWFQVAWDSRLEVNPDLDDGYDPLQDEVVEEVTTAVEEEVTEEGVAERASSSQVTAPLRLPLFTGGHNAKLNALVNRPNDQECWARVLD
jgi:hypothetical protein